MLNSLEKSLYSLLVTKAPFQIPTNGRKAMAKYLPYIALVVGILSLLGALTLYNAAMLLTAVTGYAATYGVAQNVATMAWIGILLLVVEAFIYFMAFPKLKKGEKSGWNLLFVGALLNIVYAVVTLVIGMDVMGLIWNLLSSVIGLYLLFQVHDEYLSKKAGASATPPTSTMGKK
jgi:heme/copper-type cytochrome/quinol oxidase subunit 4